MNGVQTRLKCKPNVKQCKRLVFPARSALFNHNILNTKAISHFQANHILIRFVFPPLDTPDISLFLAKAANAFLPKLVYQLEEYGLPRTLSRKIQNSGLIDLENDEMEVSDIIEEFKKIGYDKLTESIQDIHQFEKFILKYFYSGIS